jgi:ribosomal protein S12 methylthiotransferase accessory factor
MAAASPTRHAVSASFDLIADPEFGPLAAVEELPRAASAPDFIHYRARICDTRTLGAVGGERLHEAVGLTRAAAITGAVAAGLAAYAAGFYDRQRMAFGSARKSRFDTVPPEQFALFSKEQYAAPGFPWLAPGSDMALRWTPATDVAGRQAVALPAAYVWHPFAYPRGSGDLPIGEPGTAGLACRAGAAAAAYAGLMEVVERDALAIFWQARVPPTAVRLDSLPERVARLVRRHEATGDRLGIFDIHTDNAIPTFVAVLAAETADRPALVYAAASDLDPVEAAAAALLKLARIRRLAHAVKRVRAPVSPEGDWEDVVDRLDHLAFAAEQRNLTHSAFVFTADEPRDLASYEDLSAKTVERNLDIAAKRVVATGHRVYAADLTPPDIAALGLNVCRAVVPGYVPLAAAHRHRPLGARRLHEVPGRLGHRGIAPGSGGNPAPHPFF